MTDKTLTDALADVIATNAAWSGSWSQALIIGQAIAERMTQVGWKDKAGFIRDPKLTNKQEGIPLYTLDLEASP